MENKKIKETKTYSLKSLVIITFLLLIVSIVLTLIRSVKADEVVTKIKAIEKTIVALNKELTILKAEEAKYAAPNRFLEIGLSSGEISPRGEDDIIYLKLQSEYEASIFENAKENVILEENISEESKTKEIIKKKTVSEKKDTVKQDTEKKPNDTLEKNVNNINNSDSNENINSYEVESNFELKANDVITE